MIDRVCMSKQLKWNKFPYYGDRLSGKFFTGINISRQPVGENHSSGIESLIRRQVVWRNYSEQMTEKQNSVKTCTRYLKNQTPPIYGNRCSFDQKKERLSI